MKKNIEDFYDEWVGKSIAIVGNGALKEKRGAEIDSHDIVLRFNVSFTKGFEERVGSKTTVCCVGSTALFNKIAELNEDDFDIIFSLNPKEKIDKLSDKVHVYKDLKWNEMRKNLRYKYPTSGFRIMYGLYHKGIKADIYGMDFYKTRPYYWNDVAKLFPFFNRMKEYTDKNNLIHQSKMHSPKKEKQFWDRVGWFNFK